MSWPRGDPLARQRPGSEAVDVAGLVSGRGGVAPQGEGLRAVMADPTRTIERYLLETSRRHVTAEEYGAVEQALAAR